MRPLNLRNRLLVAIGIFGILQIAAGAFIVFDIRHQFLAQVDDRIETAASAHADTISAREAATPAAESDGNDQQQDYPDDDDDEDRDGHGGPPDGHEHHDHDERGGGPRSDSFQGAVTSYGQLITYVAATGFRGQVPPPDVDIAMLERAESRAFTVDALGGDTDYRIIGTPTTDGGYVVTAISLSDVRSTIDRVTLLIAASIAGLTALLGLVAWWLIRLGIAPIKRMTVSAQAIADGDLSERVIDTNPETEAGQLGHALNTMLGRIETSIEERAGAERRLREFIADASHELRTPVSTIRGYAELYQAGGLGQQADLDDAMRRTREESERMSRLINDMLGLAKLDRQRGLTIGPVDISSLAQNIVDDMRAANPDRTITLALPDAPTVLAADPDLLLQAFTNLVSNALVHTDEAVEVRVSGATFVVADHGDGMTEEVASRVTERFYREDKARARNSGGSGLGLSIVQSIVDAHDAVLTIDSKPGSGTTISISFPEE